MPTIQSFKATQSLVNKNVVKYVYYRKKPYILYCHHLGRYEKFMGQLWRCSHIHPSHVTTHAVCIQYM
jgi:hypothetical protein